MPVVPRTHTDTPHAPDRSAKRQLSPKIQKGFRCHNYISCRVQTMKPAASHCGCFTSSVKVALLRTSFVSDSCTPFSQNEAEVRKTAPCFSSNSFALRIGNRPPFVCHIQLFALHDFFHDKHQVPKAAPCTRTCAQHQQKSTCRATHAQLLQRPDWQSQWASSQDVPPQTPPWLPNQTHFLAQKPHWANRTCCSVPNEQKQDATHKIPLVQTCMYAHILGTYCLTFYPTYLVTFFLTFLLTFFFDLSFDILSDIFLTCLSDISFNISSGILSDISSVNTWGPARHTQLTGPRLGSWTPHWTHRIAAGVRHATLNSRAGSWGPARHTELRSWQLGPGTPHWTHRIAVETRRGGRGGGEGKAEGVREKRLT